MDYIKEILKRESFSYEELISCFEKVKEYGDVAVIKFDGERKENEYTVFISAKEKEMIRADESNLKDALIKVLQKYIE